MSNEKLYLKLTNQSLDLYNDETHQWNNNDIEVEYELYMELATISIREYLQSEVDVEFLYEKQIVMLASHLHSIHNMTVACDSNTGIKSISSNGRSVVFMDSNEVSNLVAIPQYIKDMLPKPKRVRVW